MTGLWKHVLWNRQPFLLPPQNSLGWKASCLLHAIYVAMEEAKKCKETGEEKNIVFGLTGTGYFDMFAYEKFNNGTMTDYIPTDEDLKQGFDGIPRFPGNEF